MIFSTYDNSVFWYHTTYHNLQKWIDANIIEDVSFIIAQLTDLPLVKLDKEGLLYHRMLSHMSLLLGPPDRKYNEKDVNRLRLVTTLLMANNRGQLFKVMDSLDPDDYEESGMYSNCTVIV